MNELLGSLQKVAEKYSTCSLKSISIPLNSQINLVTLQYIQSYFELQEVVLENQVQKQTVANTQRTFSRRTMSMAIPQNQKRAVLGQQEIIKTPFLNNYLQDPSQSIKKLTLHIMPSLTKSKISQNLLPQNLQELNLNCPKGINQQNSFLFSHLLQASSLKTLSLNLSHSEFEPSAQFNRYLSYTSKLQHLRLEQLQIKEKSQLLYFCQSLSANTSITELVLREIEVLEKFRQQLYVALANKKSAFGVLELSKCKIDSQNVQTLAGVLENNQHSLNTLVLKNNLQKKPKFLNFPSIFKAVGLCQKLQKLEFQEELLKLSQEGAEIFKTSLSNLVDIRSLFLSFENYIDLTDASLFNQSLREFKVESQSCEKFATNKVFFDITQQENSFQSLTLKGGLNDENIHKIGVLGKKHKNLQSLWLQKNNLTDSVAQTIALFLKDQKSNLLTFDISFNKFTEQGLNFILENGIGYDSQSKLKEFQFRGNLIQKSFTKVIQIFNQMKNLKTVDLDFFTFTCEEQKEQFKSLLQQNTSITKLSLPIFNFDLDQENLRLEALKIVCEALSTQNILFLSSKQLFTIFQPLLNDQELLETLPQKTKVRKLTYSIRDQSFKSQSERIIQVIGPFLESNQSLWLSAAL